VAQTAEHGPREFLTRITDGVIRLVMEHLERAFTALKIPPRFAADGVRAEHPFAVAVALAARGFRVMPSNRKKIPMLKGWPELASVDPAQLVRWQHQLQPPCWSLLCDRVIVLDRDGPKGSGSVADLESTLGPLPQTWRVNSGRAGGGEHIWLRPPDGRTDDLRNQQPLKVDGTTYKGLDVRGWHGHVVLPGSKHKSGNRYRWADGCSPDDCALAECPALWWAFLPKKEFSAEPSSTRSPRRTGAARRPSVPHDDSNLIGDDHGGFNRPIRSRCCQFFARFGVDADATEFKEALRDAILSANRDDHTAEQIERYASDSYLDAEIASARKFITNAA
jgi:hypothetical protein